MSTVTIRAPGYTVDAEGGIHFSERPSTHAFADTVAGVRLDRRKSYCIIAGAVCEAISYASACSGSDGGGCAECGYQGRRRHHLWMPIDIAERARLARPVRCALREVC